MFDPIRLGVRAFGNAVTAVPDSVYGGVTRMGDGINKAAQQIIGTQPQQVYILFFLVFHCVHILKLSTSASFFALALFDLDFLAI